MLKIRLNVGGKKKKRVYGIVVMKSDSRRDGKAVAKIGYYQPTLKNEDPYRLFINIEQYNKWISVGAQPTESVLRLVHKFTKQDFSLIKEKQAVQTKKSQPKAKAMERAKAAASE